ncbi:hypothetical protein CCMA1212_002107 [Trichoderma ghanense]|uniref:Uncharacterized protein n=1 Tax=Trichoderma ghanense TaxID=65468 RepID=A0ABY2HDP7_9HYPO
MRWENEMKAKKRRGIEDESRGIGRSCSGIPNPSMTEQEPADKEVLAELRPGQAVGVDEIGGTAR